jgi:hypothetical protein
MGPIPPREIERYVLLELLMERKPMGFSQTLLPGQSLLKV